MNQSKCQEAALAFSGVDPHADKLFIIPVQGGLINYSCLVRPENADPFILQQINKNVFKDPSAVQNNYLHIWKHAAAQKDGVYLPKPLHFNKDEFLYIDAQNNYWRACEFIEESFSPAVAVKPIQAKTTAEVFGKFTATFKDLDLSSLSIVIPDFHNLSFRFDQFVDALQASDNNKIKKAQKITDQLLARESYRDFYNHILSSENDFPKRVMHHDAKIANVLFEKESGEVICPVDFDTVMPGYFFSDLGDMIRSMACNHDEHFKQSSLIEIRPDFYEAILEGYLSVMGDNLTHEELKNIHFAGILMIYMQALRFLGDYLSGDVYYHTDYAEQNLDRALNQLTLLQKLEEYLHMHHKKDTSNYLPAK